MRTFKYYVCISLMMLLLMPLSSCDFTGADDEEVICKVIAISCEGGEVSTSKSEVIEGESVTLTAKADEGYIFSYWTVNGNIVSYENPYTTTVSSNIEYVANFKKEDVRVDLGVVDLGLSVKWATCNLGASTPEDYGDYYAWGETSSKDVFYWSSYKYSNGDKITKYLTNSEYGVADYKTVLEKSDDAAYANLGGNWRMPTKAEFDELEKNCTWEFIHLNGVYGAKATSVKNGNTIFFPCAGFNDEGEFQLVGSLGGYWSSSLHLGYNDVGYGLYLKPGNIECGPISVRSSGLTIRAVRP